MEPSGNTYLTGNSAELRDIPQGSQILTNAITERILNNKSVEDQSMDNKNKAQKLSQVSDYNKIGNIVKHLEVAMSNDNKQLLDGFRRIIHSKPEYRTRFENGKFITDLHKAGTVYKNISDRQKY